MRVNNFCHSEEVVNIVVCQSKVKLGACLPLSLNCVQEKQVILILTFSGNITSENYSDTSGKGSTGLKQLNVIALLYSRKNVEYYSYFSNVS